MRHKLAHMHFVKKETRLPYPGERVILPEPVPADRVEEVRLLEIEGKHDFGAERRQRLRRDPGGYVMASRAGIDKGLISERLHEIESRCRGSDSSARAGNY